MMTQTMGPDGKIVKDAPPTGPRGLTEEEVQDHQDELKKMRDERTRLMRADFGSRDEEVREAKRVTAENRAAADSIKSSGAGKLAELTRKHTLERQEETARIARYVKRIADDGECISALERELAALKASVSEAAQRSAADAAPSNSAATCLPESLLELLTRLNLQVHFPALLEEMVDDVAILSSMGPIQLASNMTEIGMGASEISRLSEDLF